MTASLYATLLADSRFHDFLLTCDRDLADQCRAGRCQDCGGRLHASNYDRKPRGRPVKLPREHDRRFSFCCAVDGCRSRATPPSLRFLGARVYVAAIVVLIAIMGSGASPSRLARLAALVPVPARTVARWRRWWRTTLPATPFWRTARARLMPPVAEHALPGSLLDRFAGDDRERLVALIAFLAPVTGGRIH